MGGSSSNTGAKKNPIPTKQLIDIIKKGENAMVKIIYIKEKDKLKKGENAVIKIIYNKEKDKLEKGENAMDEIVLKGTGFFFKQNIPSIKYNNKYFLMTNNHNLNENFLNDNNARLEIEYKNNKKIIPLNNRIKYTNKLLDFTIIEILPTDSFFKEIEYFFTIDNYIMDNNSEFTYLKEDIIFFQYPNGGDLSFDKGEIKSINNFQIKHLVSTYPWFFMFPYFSCK